jgi:NAD-dependent DNA ligase
MGFNLRRGLTADIQKEHAKEISKLSNEKPTDGQPVNLNHKYVCVTGTISGYTRADAHIKLVKLYPKINIENHVTSSTDYLITGHGVGQTKLNKAQEMGIPMIEAAKLFK